MFEGKSDNRRIVICSPETEIHVKGHGWFDMTIKQIDILNNADISVLAVRVEGGKTYYINFKDLKKILTDENMRKNSHEGNHWELNIWDNYIQAHGCTYKFPIEAFNITKI